MILLISLDLKELNCVINKHMCAPEKGIIFRIPKRVRARANKKAL